MARRSPPRRGRAADGAAARRARACARRFIGHVPLDATMRGSAAGAPRLAAAGRPARCGDRPRSRRIAGRWRALALAADAYAIDIDADGDGWVRLISQGGSGRDRGALHRRAGGRLGRAARGAAPGRGAARRASLSRARRRHGARAARRGGGAVAAVAPDAAGMIAASRRRDPGARSARPAQRAAHAGRSARGEARAARSATIRGAGAAPRLLWPLFTEEAMTHGNPAARRADRLAARRSRAAPRLNASPRKRRSRASLPWLASPPAPAPTGAARIAPGARCASRSTAAAATTPARARRIWSRRSRTRIEALPRAQDGFAHRRRSGSCAPAPSSARERRARGAARIPLLACWR